LGAAPRQGKLFPPGQEFWGGLHPRGHPPPAAGEKPARVGIPPSAQECNIPRADEACSKSHRFPRAVLPLLLSAGDFPPEHAPPAPACAPCSPGGAAAWGAILPGSPAAVPVQNRHGGTAGSPPGQSAIC